MRRKWIIALSVIAFVFLGGLWIWKSWSGELYVVALQTGEKKVIDTQGGFYDSDVIIRNVVPKKFSENITVYYTFDAIEPTSNSDVLDKAIHISAENREKIVTLKYLVHYCGKPIGSFNEIYIVGKNIYERYHTKIVNITINDDALFNKKDGIFVKGEAYEDYVKNGGNPDATESYKLRNYYQRGEEWAKSAQLDVWDETGRRLAQDNITIEIDGNGSRSAVVKSLQLNLEDGADLQRYFGRKYNKAILKSGGQEFESTSIRWDLVQDLQTQMGIDTAAPHELVVVYINGQYYSVMSLSLEYSARNISLMCNMSDNEIDKLTSSCYLIFRTLIDIDEFVLLSVEKKCAWVEENIDIESMFQYYAVEILTNNIDWPDANYKVWRYLGTPSKENKYQDGKWRFIVFDTDLIYLSGQDGRRDIFGAETIEKVFNSGSFDIMDELLKNEYYRMVFVNYLCSLSKTIFDEENVIKTIDKYDLIMRAELPFYEENVYNKADKYTIGWIENYKENRVKNVSDMKDAVCVRHEELLQALQKNLSLSSTYNLKIKSSNIDYLLGNDFMLIPQNCNDFNAEYFENYPLEIHTASGKCVKFIINDEEILYGSHITIDKSMIRDGSVMLRIEK